MHLLALQLLKLLLKRGHSLGVLLLCLLLDPHHLLLQPSGVLLLDVRLDLVAQFGLDLHQWAFTSGRKSLRRSRVSSFEAFMRYYSN